MNKLFYILFSLCLYAADAKAQDRSDSPGHDSTGKDKLTTRQFEDTLNQRTVVLTFEKDRLKAIYYRAWLGSEVTESAAFHIHNDSLVYVEYILSGPDIRSSPPPGITYTVYFKNDKQTGCYTSFSMGGSLSGNGFSIADKDFIKEFYYYKGVATK